MSNEYNKLWQTLYSNVFTSIFQLDTIKLRNAVEKKYKRSDQGWLRFERKTITASLVVSLLYFVIER